ncbi:MAG TPA: acyl-[ACP]--phospholipid O-acyltransferase [Bryobacteraceae bacterium]|jgi:acyl-[acyl-carrier-protein]-phospholipid O-acyltransferase/long-chain-fatty-acid--[acyl-carrier-protein] ligase|nr:acyl-[ACP]--phospholipid O-acyltransferase [Bryobacteraceae bacterium]
MPQSSFGQLLKRRGFQEFLWTQFLGAFNDNLYKIVVSMRAVQISAASGSLYLSLAGVVFVAPFLLFSGYSGHLADAVSKRKVLISVKVFEIAVMLVGLAVFFSTRVELMLVVLFLMAVHSTVFSPAKYGIVPEMVGNEDLSRANALLEMSTFVAIVLGTALGSLMFAGWKGEPWKMGVLMVAVAAAGFAVSLRITRVPAAGATGAFQWNPFAEVITGTRHLLADRALWLTVLGISYFWFLGMLLQLDLLLYAHEVLHVDDLRTGLLVTCLAVGIGAGSMLAGKLSGDKVELGLVPLGSILMAVFSVALYCARGSYGWSVGMLALLGLSSGLFIVPLNAYLQQKAEAREKGRLIATNNFHNTIGMLLASATLWLMHDRLHVGADKLILIFGVATLGATAYIVSVVPDFLIRFVLWMVTHSLFRIRVVGGQNVPLHGPALLVANHTSQVDGLLIGASIQRAVRFLVWRPIFERKSLRWFFQLMNAIPVGTKSPREAIEAIRSARRELANGELVCIFAEGSITRTGNLLPFKSGLEKIAAGANAPIVPVHLDRLWGSIFSFERGRFFWKWPKHVPYPVTVTLGQPLPATATAQEVRQAILELGSEAAGARKSSGDVLPARFLRTARANWGRFAMADSTGRELTYGRTLTGGLLVAEWLRANRRNEQMVGVLLPPSVAGAVANVGVALAARTAVNLNFTAGAEAMAAVAAQCRIGTTITSRAFLAKAKLDAIEGAVYIEDILGKARPMAKAAAWLRARTMPAGLLLRRFTPHAQTPDSLATIVFSSGSTGVPKGVMLSHYNLISNIEAMVQVFQLTGDDRIVGVLPFFHSFGFTVTIWLPLLNGCGAVYHPNPLDAKATGAVVQKHKGTFLLSTPTFCGNYVRKCGREEFASLRFVLVGAEKLREQTAREFQEKFGLGLLEGYGCTEMAPVISVNTADFEDGQEKQTGWKPGTVGHPLPGVAVKVVDAQTGEALPPNREGLLLVKGPNRMLGYLQNTELTNSVLRDGWYVTGDIAAVDDEGFIRITDRLSRFSKIGGEMVPHLKIEAAVAEILGEPACVVTGVPDERRGERLALLYTDGAMAPRDLWQRLSAGNLPALWVPKRDDIFQVDSLPLLGTGKLDLRAIKARAAGLMESCDRTK